MSTPEPATHCTGFYALVAFGTELHETCKDCTRKVPATKQVRWASYVVDKKGFCAQKPTGEVK